MKKLIQEFKDFIMRGNVLDMAIGVIIATAFNAIVTSLNKMILMPIINYGFSFIPGMQTRLVTILPNSVQVAEDTVGAVVGPDGNYYSSLNYIDWSDFIESVLNSFFIALTLFILLKVVVALKNARLKVQEELKKKDVQPVAETEPVEPVQEEPAVDPVVVLLEEIRDTLKQKESE